MDTCLEELKAALSYDKATGEFLWLKSPSTLARVGSVAGTTHNRGYIVIGYNKKRYLAHRLAWLFTYGEWPPHELDHKNGIRNDNRIDNLRLATHAQNMQNKSVQVNNSSGYVGVSRRTGRKSWVARIRINGKTIYLGCHATSELAGEAYRAARESLHQFQPVLRDNATDNNYRSEASA